ncbi:hypothetical protein E2I00_005030 [Balaenoptera physalus]|uniref:Sema domain-containing protein n=1 Tax=Balaenoptera physalus TaxID=9770 RepID=A0A6A1Q5F2_BALPH|nr:hypothetical protein E2I00_005030 [Balaenoptera physalus]
MAPHWAVWLLAVGLWGLGIGAEVWWNLVPRKTVSSGELATVVRRFSQTGIQDFLTLTLTEQTGLLYVGAREALFAFSVEALELQGVISWEAPAEKKAECTQKGKSNQTECFNFIRFLQPYNASHLYVCGTYAFQPKCTYIDMLTFTLERGEFEDGKGKCPYDPVKGHTGLLVDGELYSATLNNFLGTEPVILRNMGPHHAMKTEYLAFWLNEPHFVGSAYIPESVGSFTGDDDKVYFFFSERAVEYDCYAEQVVARVARGDVGGARTLQRKWTTFLKARLVCSAPDWQLYFNQLQALHTLQDASWHNTTFFGVFRARGDMDLSAVCEYQLEEIQRVFEGPYKEYHEQAQKWGRYTDPVPSPRPGSCINNWHRRHGYTSSLELPDNTLNFIKKHPLMEEQVGPRWGRPLLVKKDANFTHLVADRPLALFFTPVLPPAPTGDGWLLKAVSLGPWVHLIEELQVFDQEPVESLVLSRSKPSFSVGPLVPPGNSLSRPQAVSGPGSPPPVLLWQKLLFAGSRSQLVQLPLADCVKYRSCADCVLARDPYCAWSVNTSRCMAVGGHSGSLLIQHVTVSDTSSICNFRGSKKVRLTPKNITSLGLVWLAVVALGAVCLVLLLLVLSLRRRLREELEKGAKAAERTLVYPLELPKEPTSPPFRPGPETDEKLWDPVGYYYSDGSLKIVPGHARLGHPLPELADELRRKLQQRQQLPDSNPEESSGPGGSSALETPARVQVGNQALVSGTFPSGIWSAALNGDLGRVKCLIQKAADPSQPDSAGYTALFLLESGAKCDAQTHGGATALHRASYCGHTDIARLLLSHGSNPRLVDDDGMTSLHKAAEKGHVDICSLLLQHSPALKAVRDRKARLACDLLPCNSDLRDLLAS